MALKFRAMQGSYAIILQLTKIFVSFIRRNWQPARYYVAERERERENLAAETLNHSQSGTSQRDREVSCAHRVSLQSVRHFVERQRSLLRTPCFIIASPVLHREAEKFVAHTLLHFSQSGTPQRDREVFLRTPRFIIASPVLRRETEKFFCAHLASLQPIRYSVERQRSLLRTPYVALPRDRNLLHSPCFVTGNQVFRNATKKFAEKSLSQIVTDVLRPGNHNLRLNLQSLQPAQYSTLKAILRRSVITFCM